MNIYGHTFFGINSAMFGPIGLKFLWELRRLLSFYLPIGHLRGLKNGAYFSISNF